MFAGEVISQAVTRHFGGPVESGICFGIPPHHLKLNGRVVYKRKKYGKASGNIMEMENMEKENRRWKQLWKRKRERKYINENGDGKKEWKKKNGGKSE